jgi:predicted phosphodiesterase
MGGMRVAVLADIHGNLPALEAALAGIAAAGADRIVLNGDVATGPMPAETLEVLDALGDRIVWIRGNADRELVSVYDGHGLSPSLPEPARRPTEYCATRLTRRHRDLLDGGPLSTVLDVEGLGPVRFCHASTRNDTEIVLVDSPVDRYRTLFANCDEATVLLGHTHMPFDRLADRRRFVNPGSVGMPYGRTGSHWALLGPGVQLRRADYDLEAAAATMRDRAPEYPGLAEFLTDNVCGVPSDAEALHVFRPGGEIASRMDADIASRIDSD